MMLCMHRRAFPNSRALRRGRVSERKRSYLVTFRCAGRKPVLADHTLGKIVADEMHRLDLSALSKTFAFVIMPDHVHWLFELRSRESLSNVVRILKGRSSRQLNRARKGSGTVWQSGFHDRAIRHVESLREAGFYIINNPVRANLVRHWRDYPLLYLNSTIAAEAAPTGFPPGQSE